MGAPLDPRRDRAVAPLQGALRGVGLVLAFGSAVLLVAFAVVALLAWTLP